MSEMIKEFNKGDLLYIDKDGKAQWGQPEGYPRKGSHTTVSLEPILPIILYKISNDMPKPLPLNSTVRIWKNGENYELPVTGTSESHFVISESLVVVSYEDNLSLGGLIFPEKGVYFAKSEKLKVTVTGVAWNPDAIQPDIAWDGVFEATTPFSSGFLPNATTTTPGIVKQMPYLPNATGAAPTAENFNQLLRQLKNAGLMK